MIKSTERYSHGWTDASSIFGHPEKAYGERRYGAEFEKRPIMGLLTKIKKTDAHDYVTEAKDMPIEACQNLWLVTYGDEWLDSSIVAEQEPLIWEVGNRLYWAGLLEHDISMDKYRCKS